MDTLYSIVSLVGLTAIGIAAAEIYCRFVPQIASARRPDNYHSSLHGLRGFLALLVVVHACWAWFGYTRTSYFAAPSEWIENTGRIAASLFFALSGYLYWEKLRGGSFDLNSFYRNRLRRIAPAYFAVLGVMLVVVLFRTGFRWEGKEIAAQVLPYLTLGLAGDFGTMNGIDVKLLHASALFALTAQVYFYLSLPFLSWFTRGHRALLLVAICAGLTMLSASYFSSNFAGTLRDVARLYWPTSGFAIGIFASYLVREHKVNRFFKNPAMTFVALAAFVGAIFFAKQQFMSQPSPVSAACALVFFLAVANGETFRGMLNHRSLQWLGTISYSLFLAHGIVLFTMMQLLPESLRVDGNAWGRSFAVLAISCAIACAVAALLNRFVENRFMNQRRNGNDGYRAHDKVVHIRKAA